MPTFQVRDLPDHIYYALKAAAAQEHRSLSQQAIVILAKGLEILPDYQERRKNILREIQSNQAKWAKLRDQDIAAWIREDRETR